MKPESTVINSTLSNKSYILSTMYLWLSGALNNVASQISNMIHEQQTAFISIAIGSIFFQGLLNAPVIAQNTSNFSTGVDNVVGMVTITPEQINEIKKNINVTRHVFEQGNSSAALANISIVEEQFSVLTEDPLQ